MLTYIGCRKPSGQRHGSVQSEALTPGLFHSAVGRPRPSDPGGLKLGAMGVDGGTKAPWKLWSLAIKGNRKTDPGIHIPSPKEKTVASKR